MKLRDLLTDKPINVIMVRTNGPDGEDMLFGYCQWDGHELVSLDGDNYYLGEEVYKYEFDNDGSLTYWIKSKWSSKE